jgi:hypothetical protein
MNSLRHILAVALLAVLMAGVAFAQAVGDYGSVPAGGNWNVVATWMQWDGSGWNTTPSVIPLATDNVWVTNSATVILNTSGSTILCKDLTITSGATLYANSSVLSPRYIRVNGTTVTNNGILGGSADALGIYLPVVGQTLTVTGTGTTNFSRIQVQATGQTVIINANVGINRLVRKQHGQHDVYDQRRQDRHDGTVFIRCRPQQQRVNGGERQFHPQCVRESRHGKYRPH